jgi:hypothetical protein
VGHQVIEWEGGEWMSKAQAVAHLGIAETQVNRLIRVGLIEADDGKGRWKRLAALDVVAVGRLWRRLRPLLPPLAASDRARDDEDDGTAD